MLDFSRSAGVLLHISSIPSKYGVGTFGKKAFEFVDFLENAGFKYWQVLPLGPTGFGDSPYQTFSSFAGNSYFVDLELLQEWGLLYKSELSRLDFGDNESHCDYGKLYSNRKDILHKAYFRYKSKNINYNIDEFLMGIFKESYFQLEAYFLFQVLKSKNKKPWFEEADGIKYRKAETLIELQKTHMDEINFYKFVQYLFFKQYFALKEYANSKGIKIIGDISFYSPYDSCDCWVTPNVFSLKDDLSMQFVGGCPPDAFSDDGQYWGMPTYNWNELKNTGYKYLLQRLQFNLKMYDVVRLDHFRGFESFWQINASEKTARNGSWQISGSYDFFDTVKNNFGELPIIAEDLGVITDQVRSLKKFCNFPGMKVLQFAFDEKGKSAYLPHNYDNTFSVTYSGTHDNSTILGWLKNTNGNAINYAKMYLNAKTEKSFVQNFIRLTLSTISFLAIIPAQDFLQLDEDARMNRPATIGNWTWRLTKQNFSKLKKQANNIRSLLYLYNRI